MNPVALITGASRGIGRGIALALAEAGHDLVLNFRANETAAQATRADCLAAAKERGHSIRGELIQADIAVEEDRSRLVSSTRNLFGRLDLLVNNAGVAPEQRVDLLATSEESLDRLFRINLKGPFFLTQRAAGWMIELVKEGKVKEPKIVTISSISAYTASVQRGDYCISKAALSMITPLFAARLAEFGIKVFEIRPGIIATDMTSGVKAKYDALIEQGLTPIRRWGEPADVGKAVAAIATGSFPFSTGEIINVDGGFHLRTL